MASNIACVYAGALKEDLIRAVKIAWPHGFIMELPSGYEIVMGEYAGKIPQARK